MNEFNENGNQPQPVQNPGYVPQYQPPVMNEPGGSKGMAIAAMVLGIVSVVLSCCYGVGIIAAIIGLILGIIGLKNNTAGRGMALAGVILSGVAILITLLWVLIFVGLLSSPEFMRSFDTSFPYDDVFNF